MIQLDDRPITELSFHNGTLIKVGENFGRSPVTEIVPYHETGPSGPVIWFRVRVAKLDRVKVRINSTFVEGVVY